MFSSLLLSASIAWGAGVVTPLDKAVAKKHKKGAKVQFLVTKGIGAKSGFMSILTLPAGGQVPEHRDETEEYLYVLDGEGTIWIDDKSYKLKKEDSVFMPAKAKVKFLASKKGPVKVLQVFTPQGPEKKYNSWK